MCSCTVHLLHHSASMAPSKAKSKTKSKSEITSVTTSTVSLKLLIDTKRKKVLFAEAGKDFVDFLFALLSLPVGTVIRLLSKDGMVGCLGKLYQSVENLDDTYMQPNFNKDVLIKPRHAALGSSTGTDQILPLLTNGESNAKMLYTCRSCRARSTYPYPNEVCYVTDDPTAVCPQCRVNMSKLMTYVAPREPAATGETSTGVDGGGFVRGVVTYMIMDDLEVKPMSTISSIALLNNFNVRDVRLLEERVVRLDMKKGLKLLKASLQSNEVLTEVFLGK